MPSKHIFLEESDKYPYRIDTTRLHEARDIKPIDPWNYYVFEERWYPTLNRDIVSKRIELMQARKDFGVAAGIYFRDLAHFESWMHKELSKPVYYECDECDYKTTNIDAFTRHSGTNSCRIRKLKMQAAQNKKVYVAPHNATQYCADCNISFKNRYVLLRHLKTQTHLDNTNADPLPTKCLVCEVPFTSKLKTKRHLKIAKKCHRKALKDEALLKQWYYMYERFGCKFDKNIIQRAAVCIPVEETKSPESPTSTAPSTSPEPIQTHSKVLVV